MLADWPVGLRHMVVASFFFSLMSLLVKLAGQRIPVAEVVLTRALVAVALTRLHLRRRGVSPWGERRGLLLLRGLLGLGALLCFFYSVVHLPLADATVLQYTNPIFAALIAAGVLGERMRPFEGACVAASLTGVLLVARPTVIFGAGPAELDPGVGISTQLGQVYLTKGLREEPAGRTLAVGYLQIVFAALWGLAFFREAPGVHSLAGFALIVVATAALARRPAAEPVTQASA